MADDYLPDNEVFDPVPEDDDPSRQTCNDEDVTDPDGFAGMSDDIYEYDERDSEPAGAPSGFDPDAGAEAMGESERLRQPRAQSFRRRLRNQISMLPLALFLIALGAYLIAREQNVGDLPRLADVGIGITVILALGFTAVFRALVFSRYERGLLFVGFSVWLVTGAILFLAYGLEDQPDAADYWPLSLMALGLALLLTYFVERTHDTRLVLLSIIVLVAGGAALGVSTGSLEQGWLVDAAEYWPLVMTLIGISLLPLVFRPRVG
jgi:hypothetical protein